MPEQPCHALSSHDHASFFYCVLMKDHCGPHSDKDPRSVNPLQDKIEARLAEHRFLGAKCQCGWVMPSNVPMMPALEAHQAAALLPLFEEHAAEAWERGHFYCAAQEAGEQCNNPYRRPSA